MRNILVIIAWGNVIIAQLVDALSNVIELHGKYPDGYFR